MRQVAYISLFPFKRCVATSITFFVLGVNPAFGLDEIYSPNVSYRELSFEYNGSRTFDSRPDRNNDQGHQLIVEAGISPRWMVESSAGFDKSPGTETKLNNIEVESRYQFVEAGEYWLDAGLLVAYGFSTQSQRPDSLEIKLLLQKDINRITSTVNIGFSEEVGGYSSPGGADYVLLWNTRYRYSEYVQPGIEIQGDLGQGHSHKRLNEQHDYFGPTVYGRLYGRLKYQAGYFFGVSHAATHNAARVIIEYETHF